MDRISIDEFEKRFWYTLKKLEPEFEKTHHNQKVIEGLIKYFYGHKDSPYKLSKGLVIYGNTGSGKTLLMKTFYHLCNNVQLNQFQWYLCKEMLMDFKYNNGLEKFQMYCKKPACFDELEGHKKEKIYGNVEDTFGEILHVRDSYGIRTYVTMNDRPDEFNKLFGPKIESRKHTLFNVILLKSDYDYRTRK
jgi:chromosomal replication initiation ATPase DnaA